MNPNLTGLQCVLLLVGLFLHQLAQAQATSSGTMLPKRVLPAVTQPAPATVRPTAVPVEELKRTPVPGEDLDGDGFPGAQGGGADCNDYDATVYPGAHEIPNQKDEDCDPQTIGDADRDGDGFVDANVSNPGGASGFDCDDSQPAIHPLAQELPNRLDDNCDGIVDNLLGEWWTPD